MMSSFSRFKISNFQFPISNFRNENGMALIYALLMLFLIAMIGTILISTSSIEVQISGAQRGKSTTLQGAEAGGNLGIAMMENYFDAGSLTAVSGVTTTSLEGKIDGTFSNLTTFSPNITSTSIAGSGVDVQVDLDKIYSYQVAGGSVEFAMGYEGVGTGAGGGGSATLYQIDATATDAKGSKSELRYIYRHVVSQAD